MSTFTVQGTYNKITKHPADVLDYKVDWTVWLGEDTIATSTFTVDTGITKVSESSTTLVATVWISGGTDGIKYKVTNTITTAQGRTESKIFYISVTVKDAG